MLKKFFKGSLLRLIHSVSSSTEGLRSMTILVRYFMLIQPFFCISAGVAFRVF